MSELTKQVHEEAIEILEDEVAQAKTELLQSQLLLKRARRLRAAGKRLKRDKIKILAPPGAGYFVTLADAPEPVRALWTGMYETKFFDAAGVEIPNFETEHVLGFSHLSPEVALVDAITRYDLNALRS